MKVSAFFCVLIFVFQFSAQIPAQNTDASGTPAKTTKIKADILQDIRSFKPNEQAVYYASLGEILWPRDQREAADCLNKGIEIALNPATNYKDNYEKLSVLSNILVFNDAVKINDALAKKLLSKITGIINEEVTQKGSDEYGGQLLFLASHLLKKNDKLAFDFAILSLKGKKPVFNYAAFSFFMTLKQSNPLLAEQYFSKMLGVVKTSGDREHLKGLMRIASQYVLNFKIKGLPDNIPESQKKDLLEVLESFIRQESEELTQKKRTDCELADSYAKRWLETYKTILPLKAVVIEQALNVCDTYKYNVLKRPDLRNRTLRTSRDFVEAAREITDPETKSNLLYNASLLARSEKNFRFSIEILDAMDANSRERLKENWKNARFQSSVDLVSELFSAGNFLEINKVLENAPPNLRPYIIIASLKQASGIAQKYKQESFELLNLAKAEFNKMDFPLPTDNNNFLAYPVNPAKYYELANLYITIGLNDEALQTFEEFVTLQNKLSNQFTYKNKDEEIFSYYAYSSLPKRFVEDNFEVIYQNIGRIEADKIRLRFRMNLLDELLSYSKSISGEGIIKISK